MQVSIQIEMKAAPNETNNDTHTHTPIDRRKENTIQKNSLINDRNKKNCIRDEKGNEIHDVKKNVAKSIVSQMQDRKLYETLFSVLRGFQYNTNLV